MDCTFKNVSSSFNLWSLPNFDMVNFSRLTLEMTTFSNIINIQGAGDVILSDVSISFPPVSQSDPFENDFENTISIALCQHTTLTNITIIGGGQAIAAGCSDIQLTKIFLSGQSLFRDGEQVVEMQSSNTTSDLIFNELTIEKATGFSNLLSVFMDSSGNISFDSCTFSQGPNTAGVYLSSTRSSLQPTYVFNRCSFLRTNKHHLSPSIECYQKSGNVFIDKKTAFQHPRFQSCNIQCTNGLLSPDCTNYEWWVWLIVGVGAFVVLSGIGIFIYWRWSKRNIEPSYVAINDGESIE